MRFCRHPCLELICESSHGILGIAVVPLIAAISIDLIMQKQTLAAAVAALILALVTTAALAGEAGISVVFTDQEISVIRAYYRDHSGDDARHSHGKGKSGKSLPPGIAKNLQRGKPLPPGIAKQVLPTGLIELLPMSPRGFERVIVDGKVLLVEIATQVIHDVLEDAILH